MIAGIITTYDRGAAFRRTAYQVARLNIETLVVDDGSSLAEFEIVQQVCTDLRFKLLRLPKNRGLAAALNMGLAFWLADCKVDWVSYFQDDVDVHAEAMNIMREFHSLAPLLTGHDAPEHPALKIADMNGHQVKIKQSCRATHMHAHVDFLRAVMPIPTNCLGTPKRTAPGVKGMGSNVDWWIVRDAPNSLKNQGKGLVCVPGLVRSFLWRANDSCWHNQAPGGEEPPLLNR
ncbi:MAG: glycosyltransferase [Candidatus Paceibacterota bacterium]|jgi:hypothetical protein